MDVRFDDLHHARYASCATDIHNLLYYTVDADIRRDHTVNLLAVYHDHFSKVSPFFYHSFLFSEHVNVLSSWLSNVSFAIPKICLDCPDNIRIFILEMYGILLK